MQVLDVYSDEEEVIVQSIEDDEIEKPPPNIHITKQDNKG